MSPVVRNDEDTWGSDPEQDVPDRSSSKPRPLPRNSTPASPAIPSTADSESAIDDDTRRQQEMRESTEAAVLQKTGWLLLRTTARNLNSFMRGLGVKGLKVRQLYDYDYAGPWNIHAFVLLYKWKPDRGDISRWNPSPASRLARANFQEETSEDNTEHKDFIFCSQSLDNASSTQALVSALLNISEKGGGDPLQFHTQEGAIFGKETNYDVGDNIRVLKSFLKPIDSVLRGAAVCSSQPVRDAHNQAARDQLGGHPNLLDEDGKLRSSLMAEEMWMYSVFLPGHQHYYVYELEGIAEGPRVCANLDDQDMWFDTAISEVENQINVFRDHNTPFLLFTITSDIIPKNSKRRRSTGSSATNDQEEEDEIEDTFDTASSSEQDENGKSSNDGTAESEESDQETTREEIERIRATHNYEPFFVEMMKLMASRGDIQEMIRYRGEPLPGSENWGDREYE